MSIKLRKNPMLEGVWECKLILDARISYVSSYDYAALAEYTAMYVPQTPIHLSLNENFFNTEDPEQLISYIQRQVQSIWTQAVAGMAGKYTDLLIEALMPSIQEILELAQAKKNGDLL